MTDRQKINAAAHDIAHVAGWDIAEDHDFVDQVKEDWRVTARSKQFLRMAEAAFEAITGDKPDYAE